MHEQQTYICKWHLEPFEMTVQFFPENPDTKLVFTFNNEDMEESYEAILLQRDLNFEFKHQFEDLQTLFFYIKKKQSIKGIVGIGDDFSIQIKVEKEEIAMKKRQKFFTIPAFKLRQSQGLINKKLFREISQLNLKNGKITQKIAKVQDQAQELSKKIAQAGQKLVKHKDQILEIKQKLSQLEQKITQKQVFNFPFFKSFIFLLFILPLFYYFQKPLDHTLTQKIDQKLHSLQKKVKFFEQGLANNTLKLTHPINYYFSKQKKGSEIDISENGKFCTKNTINQYQYVVIENTLGKRDAKISLSIVKVAGTITFGLTTLDYLQSIKFGGTSGTKVSYAINTARQILQLNATERANSAFGVAINDVVTVELVEEKIIFRKKGDPTAIILDVEFTEEHWKRAVLFANLYGIGDSIGILN